MKTFQGDFICHTRSVKPSWNIFIVKSNLDRNKRPLPEFTNSTSRFVNSNIADKRFLTPVLKNDFSIVVNRTCTSPSGMDCAVIPPTVSSMTCDCTSKFSKLFSNRSSMVEICSRFIVLSAPSIERTTWLMSFVTRCIETADWTREATASTRDESRRKFSAYKNNVLTPTQNGNRNRAL